MPRVPVSTSFVLAVVAACAGPAGEPAGVEGAFPPVAGPIAAMPPPPPRLTEVHYTLTPQGPRVLVRGEDPAEAVERLHLEFFDGDGESPQVDADGDGELDAMAVDVDVLERDKEGFLVEVNPTRGLERIARQVAVTPAGGMVTAPERRLAVLSVPVTRGLGERCSPDGFDECAPGGVCAPGRLAAMNRCVDSEDLRTSRCASAAHATAPFTMRLDAADASLWEPPAGCASPDRNGKPEALLWMTVPTKMASITLRTKGEGSVDAVLYVLAGCASGSGAALACNDDTRPPDAELTLSDVDEGTYLVVVDTLGRRGGTVTLEATTP